MPGGQWFLWRFQWLSGSLERRNYALFFRLKYWGPNVCLGDEILCFFLDGPWWVYCYGSIKMSLDGMMGGNFFSYPRALMMYQLINSCLLADGKTELATANQFMCREWVFCRCWDTYMERRVEVLISLHTTVEYSCTPKVGNVAHETLGLESNEFPKLGSRASLLPASCIS